MSRSKASTQRYIMAKKLRQENPILSHKRSGILKEVADLLPSEGKGNLMVAAHMLSDIEELTPFISKMSDSLLLRRIRLIAESETLTAECLSLRLDPTQSNHTIDGYFITPCRTCKRYICLVPARNDSDLVYDVTRRSRKRRWRHLCENNSLSVNDTSYGKTIEEQVGQHYTDQEDATRGLGNIRRESDGRYGSPPAHDDHD